MELFINKEHAILDNSKVFAVLSFSNLNKELRNELKAETYSSWLKSVSIKSNEKGELYFKVAEKTFVNKKLFDKVLNFIEKVLGYRPTEVLYKEKMPLFVVFEEQVVFVVAPKIIEDDDL